MPGCRASKQMEARYHGIPPSITWWIDRVPHRSLLATERRSQ
ncbi:hypothetical protein RESH_00391 [Rhodopirellula europaea SH398]|uniref:Uncharacterized protein n=1 Tax=Rhodopirellula europaea SH398 TaxID=1263868 RepID=M5SMR6_9BACT|nr:hypothetical protein RESH_00391 [Rhodopirellula europaea SH398]